MQENLFDQEKKWATVTEPVLYEGNCLDFLPQIADSSIASIITDPPYMSAMQHNGSLTDFSDCENLRPFFRLLMKEFDRVLSDKGCLYFFCDWKTYPFYFSVISETFRVRNMLVWWKGSGCGNFYTLEHELIIFVTKNNQFHCKDARNVIQLSGFAQGAKSQDGEKVHPTQKPTELIRKLILDSTKEGDAVFDTFMGSGTTGVACKQTNRAFYGSELQHKYFEIATRRIAEA